MTHWDDILKNWELCEEYDELLMKLAENKKQREELGKRLFKYEDLDENPS